MISQLMHSPKEKQFEAVHRVLSYLKGAPGKGLFFKKNNSRMAELYTDADKTDSLIDKRSTLGYCSYVWGNLVSWRTKKQSVVVSSSTEAEFQALAQGICEDIWLEMLLRKLKMTNHYPMRVYYNNKAI